MSFQMRRNQDGATSLLVVMAVLVAVMLAFVGVITQSRVLDQRVRTVRMRAQMTAMESRLKSLLSQPAAYTCAYDPGGSINCAVNGAFISKFMQVPVRGLGCSSGAPCALSVVSGPTFDNASRNVTLTLEAVGTTIGLSKKDIQFQVPDDVLHANAMDCSAQTGGTRPVFKGFTAGGQVNCQPLPATDCGAPNFVTGINPNTGGVQCAPFDSSTKACAPSQYISYFQWNGGASLSYACVGRQNPFAGASTSGGYSGPFLGF